MRSFERNTQIATCETRWEIAEPVRPHPSTYPSVAVDGDHVLFGGIDFAAVDLETGEVGASSPAAAG
jgi:hypothetical protein